jgi:hypothetical protein
LEEEVQEKPQEEEVQEKPQEEEVGIGESDQAEQQEEEAERVPAEDEELARLQQQEEEQRRREEEEQRRQREQEEQRRREEEEEEEEAERRRREEEERRKLEEAERRRREEEERRRRQEQRKVLARKPAPPPAPAQAVKEEEEEEHPVHEPPPKQKRERPEVYEFMKSPYWQVPFPVRLVKYRPTVQTARTIRRPARDMSERKVPYKFERTRAPGDSRGSGRGVKQSDYLERRDGMEKDKHQTEREYSARFKRSFPMGAYKVDAADSWKKQFVENKVRIRLLEQDRFMRDESKREEKIRAAVHVLARVKQEEQVRTKGIGSY